MQLWQIHVAEQMILDDLEANPEKYQNQKLSELVDDDYDEEKSVEYTKAYYKKALIPKVILVSYLMFNIRQSFDQKKKTYASLIIGDFSNVTWYFWAEN